MFDFDDCCSDWGSWGIGDFYDGIEEELRKMIESGEIFDTGVHSYRHKPQQYMRICRNVTGEIMVFVSEHIDDAFEEEVLFDDFLEDDEFDLLTDEKLDEIREHLYMGDFVLVTEEEEKLPKEATFEQIIDKAKELMKHCLTRLHESFLKCIVVTLAVLYDDFDDKSGRIADRIKKYQ